MITIKNLRKEQPSELWDIRVDRKCILGNPYYLSNKFDDGERAKVCNKYKKYFNHIILASEQHIDFMAELNRLKEIHQKYGKLNLFCWCAPKKCHAETIKQYLEREEK